MALSANVATNRVYRQIERSALEIVNTEVMYWGSFIGVNNYTHGTSGDIGRVEAYTGEAEQIPLAAVWADSNITGSGVTGSTSANDPPSAGFLMRSRIMGGDVGMAVTGVTAITDFGKYVYLSDDNTMTLTRPTRGVPVGVIWKYAGVSGYAEVLCFSVSDMWIIGMTGNAQDTLFLGAVTPTDIGSIASAKTVFSIAAPYHGSINAFRSSLSTDVASSAARMGLEVKIGGVLVTSAFVQLGGGDTIGDTEVGTATALNIFNEGDVITVTTGKTIVTGWSAGTYNTYLEVTKLAGA